MNDYDITKLFLESLKIPHVRPEKVFNSFTSRNTVKKLRKKITSERGDLDWSKGLTIGNVVDYFWVPSEPKKKSKKKAKKK